MYYEMFKFCHQKLTYHHLASKLNLTHIINYDLTYIYMYILNMLICLQMLHY